MDWAVLLNTVIGMYVLICDFVEETMKCLLELFYVKISSSFSFIPSYPSDDLGTLAAMHCIIFSFFQNLEHSVLISNNNVDLQDFMPYLMDPV